MSKQYTLSDLITDLQAIEEKHGNIAVEDAKGHPLFSHHVEAEECDDWNNTTISEDGEVPGKAFILRIGRGY
jgi:hypothetical protein